MASKAVRRYAPYLLRDLVRDGGRGDELHPALDVLRLVIVEAVLLDDDLTGDGDLRVLVAEDGDLDLPGVDALLDDDAPVEARGLVDGFAKLLGVRRPLPMPTLEPRFAGLTKQGYPRESSISSVQVSLFFSHCFG